MMLLCDTCKAEVLAGTKDGVHDTVYRFNTSEGPGPFPYMVLHSSWAPPPRQRPLRDDDPPHEG